MASQDATVVARIADEVSQRSARGIASAVGRLISSGVLSPGDRLPTVRVVADSLGTSPTTISQAWRSLVQVGLIQTRGRSGSFVSGQARTASAAVLRRQSMSFVRYKLDLSTSLPDPELLPDISAALPAAGNRLSLRSYLDEPVVPELRDLLASSWPYPAPDLTVVNGALDAIDRTFDTLLSWGGRVAVADPCFHSILDLIETHGANPIGVTIDDHGLVPESLRAALDLEPTLLILQPRAQNQAGASMTAERAATLAGVLEGHPDVTILEDDHSADIAMAPARSLGNWFAERTIHIKSFSKSHGPDLRIGAVSGPSSFISDLVNRRRLGPGWTSRLLQNLLVGFLTDPEVTAAVAAAREIYGERRRAISAELDRFGVEHMGSDGLNLWITVKSEREAMLALAAQGIGVAPGSSFNIGATSQDHIRVTTGLVRGDFDVIGRLLAAAALGIANIDGLE